MNLSHLRALLSDHAPFDEVEAAHLSAMRSLIDVEGDPCSRAHFAPGHFTASAFVVSKARERLLLIFHPKLARWLQPGGHLEREDGSPLAAARRELLEETRLANARLHPLAPELFDVDVHEIPARKDEPAHRHYDLRFLFVASEEEAGATSEVSALAWVSFEEAEQKSDASVARAVRKLRALAAKPGSATTPT